jgi:DNA-binding transcriptional MerR regulator
VPALAKSGSAFRTIGELSGELGIPQHILRYWETRFPQLRPLQRAGNRRYYRPEDVALVKRIHALLSEEGYTVKGVQKLLASRRRQEAAEDPHPTRAEPQHADIPALPPILAPALYAIRDRLKQALDADDIAARL